MGVATEQVRKSSCPVTRDTVNTQTSFKAIECCKVNEVGRGVAVQANTIKEGLSEL